MSSCWFPCVPRFRAITGTKATANHLWPHFRRCINLIVCFLCLIILHITRNAGDPPSYSVDKRVFYTTPPWIFKCMCKQGWVCVCVCVGAVLVRVCLSLSRSLALSLSLSRSPHLSLSLSLSNLFLLFINTPQTQQTIQSKSQIPGILVQKDQYCFCRRAIRRSDFMKQVITSSL